MADFAIPSPPAHPYDERRWSDADMAFAYQLGAERALAALDDARQAVITPVRLSPEQRVQQRIAEMEAHAARFHAKHGTRPFAGVSA